MRKPSLTSKIQPLFLLLVLLISVEIGCGDDVPASTSSSDASDAGTETNLVDQTSGDISFDQLVDDATDSGSGTVDGIDDLDEQGDGGEGDGTDDSLSTDSPNEDGPVCTELDGDDDGFVAQPCGGDDCDDSNPAINPTADEVCDGADNNCDGEVDFGLGRPGDACDSPDDCCSGACFGEMCLSDVPPCAESGESCMDHEQCCSGLCERGDGEDGVCVETDACLGNDEPCVQAADCCSTACFEGFCRGGASCLIAGTACATDSDCCSDDCDDASGVCVVTGCGGTGEACGEEEDCCSRNCIDGYCLSTGLCRPEGDSCSEDDDCCNHACEIADGEERGNCVDLTGCLTFGEPCSGGETGARNCCSNTCGDIGTGVNVCRYLTGCRPMGEICFIASDEEHPSEECCSGVCESDHGVLRCATARCQHDPHEQGQNPGEVCGRGGSNNCCDVDDEGGSGSIYCQPTVLESSRCLDTLDPECFPDGEPCSLADSCCSGLCLPGPEGELLCGGGETCAEADGFCTEDDDCCDVVLGCNSVNRCADEPGGDCLVNDEICETDEECCSTLCQCIDEACSERRCTERVDCVPTFHECDSDLDCCDDECIIMPGESVGACLPACVEEGGTCTADVDCCEGYCGADSTCQPPLGECSEEGEPCESVDDCCHGLLCNTESGICYILIKD